MPSDIRAVRELDPVLEFLRTIWALNHSIERTSIRMESKLGITAQQRFVIRLVGELPGTTPGELAELLHVDRGSITAVLKRLEARALVIRTPDPLDRRKVSLSLTKLGRRLNVPATTSVEHAVELALARTSPSDVAAVRRLTRRLIASLDHYALVDTLRVGALTQDSLGPGGSSGHLGVPHVRRHAPGG